MTTEQKELQYVVFSVDGENYGVDIMAVQEIMHYTPPTVVHGSDPALVGVINFRGTVIPIVDVRLRFGLSPVEPDKETVIVVVEASHKTIGLLVEKVTDIVTAEEIDNTIKEQMETEYVDYIAKTEKTMVMVVDPVLLLDVKEFFHNA